MINDPFLRWVVAALFVVSAAECGYGIARHHRSFASVVSNLLHGVMAVAMAVMAWPSGAALPTTAPMVFFLLATVWFVVATLVQAGHRGVNGYHAAMMLAMAWMYAVMGGSLLPTPSDNAGATTGGGHHGSSSMPGMNMPGVDAAPAPDATPPFITGLNWLCTVGFAVATLWWLYRLFAQRRSNPQGPRDRDFGVIAQSMMAAGMAVMFAVML